MTAAVVMLGMGGHARVLSECLRLSSVEILAHVLEAGGVSPDPNIGTLVLADGTLEAAFPPGGVILVNGIGSVANTGPRCAVFDRFKAKGYSFMTVVHPSAVVADDTEFGEGAQIMAGAVIQPGVRIGDDAIINTRASIDHDCRIGKHVHIGPGAILCGSVQVGAGAHVGSGTSVIQGARIGAGAVVGIGAAVVADVEDGTTVCGVPARRLDA